MSRKMKILVSVLLVAALLTVGVTATVLAEGEDEDTTTAAEEEIENDLLDRVAEILDIEREELVNAFEQARQEMCNAAFIDRVNEAVTEGLITQEKADAIIEWWEQKPAGLGEWWRQKPEYIPGAFRHTLRFNVSPQFNFQNALGEGGCFRLFGR